jgi:hypothetical protein
MGAKPLFLTAIITDSLGAFPLPVICFLIVPTGMPLYGIP